jgi:hypothetical protein
MNIGKWFRGLRPPTPSEMKPWARRSTFGAGIGGFVVAVLIGFDQLGNTLLGGDPDMTISTRCGLEQQHGKPSLFCRAVCAGLEVVDKNHCADARE